MKDRLKKIRLDNDLSQEEFAKKIGLESRGHISALEKGSRNITDRIINDVCRVFAVNEAWFRTGEGGDENMYKKLPDEDRYSLNLGKLSVTENEFVKRSVNLLAETDPDKLKILEEFMKKWLGIE